MTGRSLAQSFSTHGINVEYTDDFFLSTIEIFILITYRKPPIMDLSRQQVIEIR